MTQIEFIRQEIEKYRPREPIYTAVLAAALAKQFQMPERKAALATAVVVKRLLGRGVIPSLRFYQKGIYYKTKRTAFGEMGISMDALIFDKYLAGDNGYETGAALLHQIGLTTQIPGQVVIATNKRTDGLREDKKLGVFVRPAKTTVTKENKRYLQILDVLELFDRVPIDAAEPFRIVSAYIAKLGLEYKVLLDFAGRFYTKDVVFKLARVAGSF